MTSVLGSILRVSVRRIGLLLGLCLIGLAGCATDPGTRQAGAEPEAWQVLGLDQVKRIAEIRSAIDEMRIGFRDVIILRMDDDEKQRVEVTSIGPTLVSVVKDGAPAARTTFGITEKRDYVALLTQDVPARKAFHREIPMTELTVGRSFRFPVVLESGEIRVRTFTVQQVIVR